MAFSRTSNFLAHPYAAKVVKTVRTIVHDIDPIKPTTERLYMWEAFAHMHRNVSALTSQV